ncbi:hypothetical protein [Flavobacterium aquicola]|uniref:Uncharacterized protein n=1 Tax=Flavobacterium aquicola TaxID=1682742 RepID=A0A3E0EPK0_9FLAO|nr:hypothetical protein [Flavobacterium aquicola]REG99650.1 hypothetical protein C8P67_104280 [Flavobacterium aquicola]
MNIKTLVLLAVIIILILNYKRILSLIEHYQEQRAAKFKRRTGLDLFTLTRISARPKNFLFGLEMYIFPKPVFYFDDNNLYRIKLKEPIIKHALSTINEVRRTSITINERRVWEIIINDSGKQINYRLRSNYDKFDLFLEKIKENPNAIVDSKYVWGIFE